jgi:hypothetical protein
LQTETRANINTINTAMEIKNKAIAGRYQLEEIGTEAGAIAVSLHAAMGETGKARRQKLETAQRQARGLEQYIHDSDTPEGYDGYARWVSQLVIDLQGEIDAA